MKTHWENFYYTINSLSFAHKGKLWGVFVSNEEKHHHIILITHCSSTSLLDRQCSSFHSPEGYSAEMNCCSCLFCQIIGIHYHIQTMKAQQAPCQSSSDGLYSRPSKLQWMCNSVSNDICYGLFVFCWSCNIIMIYLAELLIKSFKVLSVSVGVVLDYPQIKLEIER